MLADGRLRFLTEIPADVLAQAPSNPPPTGAGRPSGGGGTGAGRGAPGGGAGGGGGAAGGAGGGGAGGGALNTPIVRVNQNQNLKTAWAATGHTGVYSVGSPFRDESQQHNRREVPSDTAGVRICLPMALVGHCYSTCRGKHEALSAAEVRRVAEAGNLQVAGLCR